MTFFDSIIMGIIEGLTEFLPVSSTGHLILTSNLLQIPDSDFVKTFDIAIQLGAILSVLTLYYKRFLQSFDIYVKLTVAFIPTGIVGLLAYKTIKFYLFNPIVVSIALIVGGVILIILDRWSEDKPSQYFSLEDISYLDALKIGAFQCLSMIPGTSRAAATIIGGIYAGFDRRQAAEFSFLLAIPTMFAATGYDLLKMKGTIGGHELQLLIVGCIVSFIFAFIAVRAFVNFLTKHGFKLFGYYRIALGLITLVIALIWGFKL